MNETWKINGNEIIFEDLTHTYYFNNKKCISVTQILKNHFPEKYEGVPEEVLKRAAERGTFVHESIEFYEKYGWEEDDCIQFKHYLELKKKYNFEVEENEVPVYLNYNGITICGRLDEVVSEKGKRGIADIKCTSEFDKEYLACQLNIYRLAYLETYSKDIEFLRGIHLTRDKGQYSPILLNEKIASNVLDEYIFNNGKKKETLEKSKVDMLFFPFANNFLIKESVKNNNVQAFIIAIRQLKNAQVDKYIKDNFTSIDKIFEIVKLLVNDMDERK